MQPPQKETFISTTFFTGSLFVFIYCHVYTNKKHGMQEKNNTSSIQNVVDAKRKL
jgi:hypothetical protein